MTLEIETKRLILRVLTPDYAQDTLDFYMAHPEVYEKYEPIFKDEFYTLNYHEKLLQAEYQQTLLMRMFRFWIFEKDNPEQIIGTVSFHGISPDIYSCCSVGYKIAPEYWRKGYAYEAINASIEMIAKEIGIRRFEALVLPDNTPSIKLLEKLGFEKEGVLKEKIFIQGQWRDHIMYGLLVK